MSGMDMSNTPSLVILREFYSMIGVEAVIGAAIVFLLWLGLRSDQPRIRRPEMSARRWLRWGFGVLWILDGLLQMQPGMSTGFVPNYLVPLMNGQPSGLNRLMEVGIILFASHPLFWDTLSGWLQITIGGLMIGGYDTVWERIGLWIAIFWSIVVWVMGEGLGNLLVPGNNTWLAGTPGSVVFYGLAAALLLQSEAFWESGRVRLVMSRLMAGLWLLMGLLQWLPADGYWHGATLAGPVLAMAEMAQPAVLSHPLYVMARILPAHGPVANALIGGIMLVLAVGWWLRRDWVVWLTVVWAFLTWWLAQDFGVFGGTATDPNSGLPVMILVLTAVYGVARALPKTTDRDLAPVRYFPGVSPDTPDQKGLKDR